MIAQSPQEHPRMDFEQLKISVLAKGVAASEGAVSKLAAAMTLTTHEYPTTGGIACRVGDVYLNAPFDEWYCVDAEVILEVFDDKALFRHREKLFAVDEIFPVPDYVGALNPDGLPYDEVAFSHLDRVRLSPIVGCAHDCAFCDLPGRIDLRPYERLVEAGEVALKDGRLPIRHMLISGGSPGPRQREAFAETVLRLVEFFAPKIEVDVMMSAGPNTCGLVHQLADAGVYGLALNIELFSEEASAIHIRSKHRHSRPYLEETIEAAVGRLGRTGRVRSLLIPGLEPLESTLAGVDAVARLGADPVISPFRPASGTILVDHEPCRPDDLRSLLDAARRIVSYHGVALGPRCLPCQHNTLTFPWDVPDES